ncbi:hypothetical protein FRC09_000044 [Ceratobasidium sp. 395]|nr:hypothetical protein FRC09_000044 [Ceratobasidium sp. 395]
MSAQSTLNGATLVERVTRPGSVGSGPAGSNPLDDITIKDGFYHILQDIGGETLKGTYQDSSNFKFWMQPNADHNATVWYFTRQWAIKNSFTIATLNTKLYDHPPTAGSLKLNYMQGTISLNSAMFSSACFILRCDESTTYRLEDGSTKTINYFRMLVPSDTPPPVLDTESSSAERRTVNMSKDETWDPISPRQLFRFERVEQPL